MRRATTLVMLPFVALFACKTSNVAEPPKEPAAAHPAASAPSSAAVTRDAAADVRVAAVVPAEAPPLKWGARPAKTGTLFPIVDGMCIHAEVWPVEGGVVLSYGNRTVAWSRGSLPTLAQITDVGVVDDATVIKMPSGEAWDWGKPNGFQGRWPDRVVFTDDRSGRVGDPLADVWLRDGTAWRRIFTGAGTEGAATDYHSPFLRGNAMVLTEIVRRYNGGAAGEAEAKLRVFPFAGDAPAPLPASFAKVFQKGFTPVRVVPWKDELLAFGTRETLASPKMSVRYTTQGSVREESLDALSWWAYVVRPAATFVLVFSGPDNDLPILFRFDGITWKHDPAEALLKTRHTKVIAAAGAPNDETWLVLGDGTLWIEAKDGTLTERSPPERLSNGSSGERGRQHRAQGTILAGVESGDPWVVARSGAVYRYVDANWQKIDMPKPPFSSGGIYKAESVTYAAGDVFVNAGYSEKETGWRTPEPYRAILRMKRPDQTLRCNEPDLSNNGGSGKGFKSWPPVADDTCATPFVVLVAHGLSQKAYGDYPNARKVLQGRAALGETASLVEFQSGDRHYMGMRVPSIAEGKSIAEALGRKVDSRPEIVCGEPPPERTLEVDVSTGKLRSAP